MARAALIEKSKRKPKYSTRVVRRCKLCGRNRAYLRRFGMCRLCFRENANQNMIPGVTKSSW